MIFSFSSGNSLAGDSYWLIDEEFLVSSIARIDDKARALRNIRVRDKSIEKFVENVNLEIEFRRLSPVIIVTMDWNKISFESSYIGSHLFTENFYNFNNDTMRNYLVKHNAVAVIPLGWGVIADGELIPYGVYFDARTQPSFVEARHLGRRDHGPSP